MRNQILKKRDIRRILPARNKFSHKGNMGKVLLLCGSEGFTGAAALAAMGALRSGAGLVYLGVPRPIYSIEAVKLNEAIVFPLDAKDGMLSIAAISAIAELLPRMDAVLIGPGLGVCDDIEEIVCYICRHFDKPVIIDADGISVMKKHKDILRDRTGVTILTPHEGEFSRFADMAINNRLVDAEKLASDLGCIVVLKGHRTIITDGKKGYMNPTGNPGMAVGGCGDVLAGMIVSLLGQGLLPLEAAACAAWLHGAAGDVFAKKFGQYGLLPSDILDILPRLMR